MYSDQFVLDHRWYFDICPLIHALTIYKINTTVKLTKTDDKTIRTILAGYKMHNVDVMIREDVSS